MLAAVMLLHRGALGFSFVLLSWLGLLAGCADHGQVGGDNPHSDGGTSLPDGCEPGDTSYAAFVEPLVAQRCLACHSVSVVGDARVGAPVGVNFDTEADVSFHQARIRVRVVEERAMPPGAPLSDCDAARLGQYLDSLGGEGACEPVCTGKDCGPDGCGGVCGTCTTGEMCGSAGLCVAEGCQPDCLGVACGPDGCGGVCGSCGPGLGCDASGQCVCAPNCDALSCGDDGCGGSCGECSASDVCGLDGNCLCIPSCAGAECGDTSDGCGGPCGTCPSQQSCVSGACEACVPGCGATVCGYDPCGNVCDSCPGAQVCNTRTLKCVVGCTKDCNNRVCGDDGCGGSCGAACTDPLVCIDGQCACEPQCVGKVCGDDMCGGTCGTCSDGLTCTAGQCGCSASCTGRECGSDGCGGSCGTCADGLSCSAGQCVAQCVPSCIGKDCGDDGCGGSCGSCGAAQSCDTDQCIDVAVSFDLVYSIFTKAGCGSAICHGGAAPKESLDLSTMAKAQAALVDVNSAQCSGKKRVLSGDASQSYLINKLTGVGMCSGSQMPKASAALSAAEIDTIRAWINGL